MKKTILFSFVAFVLAFSFSFTFGCDGGTEKSTNEITKLEMAEYAFDETPSVPVIEATYGADTVKYSYSTEEAGEYIEITEFPALQPGTYYLKAVIAETDDYLSAEKVVAFTVNNHTTHTGAGEWVVEGENHYKLCVCGEKVDLAAHAGAGEWMVDGDNHYKLCVCGEKVEVAAHTCDETVHYDVENMKEYNLCTICGARLNEVAHAHAGVGEWVVESENHYKLCVCNERVEVAAHTSDETVHYDVENMKEYNLCTVCGARINEVVHAHAGVGEWVVEGENHYKLCVCGEKTDLAAHAGVGEWMVDGENHYKLCVCNERVEVAAHTSDETVHYDVENMKEYNLCTICGARLNEVVHAHAGVGEWVVDGENHYKLCVCNERVEVAAHTSDETVHYDVENMKEYNLCTVCGARINEVAHAHNYAILCDDGKYACGCGNKVVDGFSKLYKVSEKALSDAAELQTEKIFGTNVYSIKGLTPNLTNTPNALYQYKVGVEYNMGAVSEYRFALKSSKTVLVAAARGENSISANTWYIVRVAKTGNTEGAKWSVSVKTIEEEDSAFRELVGIGDWKIQNNTAGLNTILENWYIWHDNAHHDDEEFDLYATGLYEVIPDSFANTQMVQESALQNATLVEEKFLGANVYSIKGITPNLTNTPNALYQYKVGVEYSMGAASEYRFALKVSKTVLVAAARGENSISANTWYIVRVAKTGNTEGAKWSVSVKTIEEDDSAFRELVSIGDWKLQNDTAGLNTILENWYIWHDNAHHDDEEFDLYATGLYEVIPDSFANTQMVQESALQNATLVEEKILGANVYNIKGLTPNLTNTPNALYQYKVGVEYSMGTASEYRFALKASKTVLVAAARGENSISANTWYIVRVAKTGNTEGAKWSVSVKTIEEDDSAFRELVGIGDWKIQNNTAGLNTILENWYIWHDNAHHDDEEFDLYATGLYEVIPDSFANTQMVQESALQNATLVEEKILGANVYNIKGLTPNLTNTPNALYQYKVGVEYSMGTASEYRFALKASKTVLVAAARGENAIEAGKWYIVKVEKLSTAAENGAKWSVSVKLIEEDDSAFRELVGIGDWKLQNDTASLHAILENWYIWHDNDHHNDEEFNLYATGLFAVVPDSVA